MPRTEGDLTVTQGEGEGEEPSKGPSQNHQGTQETQAQRNGLRTVESRGGFRIEAEFKK